MLPICLPRCPATVLSQRRVCQYCNQQALTRIPSKCFDIWNHVSSGVGNLVAVEHKRAPHQSYKVTAAFVLRLRFISPAAGQQITMGKPDLGTITLISLSVESFILANVFWLFALSTRLSVKRVIATKHSVGCGGSLARLYFREPFHAAIAILLSFSVVVSRISHSSHHGRY